MIRVAVEDSNDAIEFRLVNQVWVSEDCEVVRLDFAEPAAREVCGQPDLLDTLLRFELLPVPIQHVM